MCAQEVAPAGRLPDMPTRLNIEVDIIMSQLPKERHSTNGRCSPPEG